MSGDSMGWPRKLILVRHAESEGNVLSVDDRTGLANPTHRYGLTDRGREQARITGLFLNSQFYPQVFYVSYYERSKETMKIMFPDAKQYEDYRLAEAQRGIYHFMARDQIQEKYPEEVARKNYEGLYHYRPPGGENWPDVELRIHSFLGTLNRDYSGKEVLIVVHGHWLQLFQKQIHHFSVEEAIQRYKKGVFDNASVTIYESPDGNRLNLVNENIVPWKGRFIDTIA